MSTCPAYQTQSGDATRNEKGRIGCREAISQAASETSSGADDTGRGKTGLVGGRETDTAVGDWRKGKR